MKVLPHRIIYCDLFFLLISINKIINFAGSQKEKLNCHMTLIVTQIYSIVVPFKIKIIISNQEISFLSDNHSNTYYAILIVFILCLMDTCNVHLFSLTNLKQTILN